MAQIILDNVEKTYSGGIKAIDDLSLDIKDGEFMVFVGPSGCGKQVDTPQALFEAPVNLFVAGFIGSPAMNFVTAELVRDDGPAVTLAGYKLPVPREVLEAKPGLAAE